MRYNLSTFRASHALGGRDQCARGRAGNTGFTGLALISSLGSHKAATVGQTNTHHWATVTGQNTRHSIHPGRASRPPSGFLFLVSPIHGASHDLFPRQGKKRTAWALRQPFRQASFNKYSQPLTRFSVFRSSATPHRRGRDTAVLPAPARKPRQPLYASPLTTNDDTKKLRARGLNPLTAWFLLCLFSILSSAAFEPRFSFARRPLSHAQLLHTYQTQHLSHSPFGHPFSRYARYRHN